MPPVSPFPRFCSLLEHDDDWLLRTWFSSFSWKNSFLLPIGRKRTFRIIPQKNLPPMYRAHACTAARRAGAIWGNCWSDLNSSQNRVIDDDGNSNAIDLIFKNILKVLSEREPVRIHRNTPPRTAFPDPPLPPPCKSYRPFGNICTRQQRTDRCSTNTYTRTITLTCSLFRCLKVNILDRVSLRFHRDSL